MLKNNAFCSICTFNYLPYAAVLNESLRDAGHKEPHYLLVIDHSDKMRSYSKTYGFSPVFLKDLAIPNVDSLIQKYDAFELCNVLKPYFFEWLLKTRPEISALIYLDCDIFVYSPFTKVFNYLADHKDTSLLISPHNFSAEDYVRETGYHLEKLFMSSGLYNGGFYTMKNDQNTLRFLNWHKKKLRNYGYKAPNVHMFVDQKILDFAPVLFDFVGIYKDPSYNAGHWNYHKTGQKPVFFHFSQPKILARLAKSDSRLSKLLTNYDLKLKGKDLEKFGKINYGHLDRYQKPPLLKTDPIAYLHTEIALLNQELTVIKSELTTTKRKLDAARSNRAWKVIVRIYQLFDLIKASLRLTNSDKVSSS